MGKQWYDFFGRARKEKNSLYWSVIGIFLWVSPSWAVTGEVQDLTQKIHTQKVSKAETDSSQEQDFLQLPAFDLERSTESAKVQNQESPPSKSNRIEGSGVKVGDRVNLQIINFKLPEGIVSSDSKKGVSKELTVEALPSEDLGEQGWEVQSSVNLAKNTSSHPTGNDYIVTVFPIKPGHLTLPSLVIKDTSGKAIARTNPFSLEVQSAIAATDSKPDQPEEIAPPVGLQFPWRNIILAISVLLLVVAAGGYAFYRWKKSRKPKIASKLPEIIRSEDETALIQLAELERSGLMQKGEIKKFYFRLSEILKNYIGARYRFDAPESTTREIILYLESNNKISDPLLDRLESIFNKLDRVKFTDYLPETQEPIQLLQEAKEYILTTRRAQPVVMNSTGATTHAIR